MKKIFATLMLMLVGSSAFAVTYVPYNTWTYLPHCGGMTRLVCDDVPQARQRNQCRIEFRNSYNCSQIKMYVTSDFHPGIYSNVMPMSGEFYVDNNKVGVWSDSFRVFLNSGEGSAYDQVRYQFAY